MPCTTDESHEAAAQGMTQEQYQQYQQYQEQQQGDQGQGQQAPPQPTYQQLVDQRNQAIAQAILNAHSQAVARKTRPLGIYPAQQQTSGPAIPQQQQVCRSIRFIRYPRGG